MRKKKGKFIPQLTHDQLIQLAKQEIKEWRKFLKDLTKVNEENQFQKLKADGYYDSKARWDI